MEKAWSLKVCGARRGVHPGYEKLTRYYSIAVSSLQKRQISRGVLRPRPNVFIAQRSTFNGQRTLLGAPVLAYVQIDGFAHAIVVRCIFGNLLHSILFNHVQSIELLT